MQQQQQQQPGRSVQCSEPIRACSVRVGKGQAITSKLVVLVCRASYKCWQPLLQGTPHASLPLVIYAAMDPWYDSYAYCVMWYTELNPRQLFSPGHG